MKFLFLSHSSPFREGGVETRTREVAAAFLRRGHRVTVLCAKTQADEPERELRDGLEIRCVRVVPDWFLRRFPFPHYFTLAAANLFLAFHLLRVLRREKFDCLREELCPFPISSWLAFFRLPVSRRLLVVHQLPGAWKNWLQYYGPVFAFVGYLMEKCLRAGWLRYDRIILPSPSYARQLSPNPKLADRIIVIPNGVSGNFYSVPSAREGGATEIRRLVNVGRMVKIKGQILLIQALAALRPRFPGLRLAIVGKGPLLEYLRTQAGLAGLGDRVEFIPRVPHEAMPEFLDSFDLLLMPSYYEGYNITLLEAIARGLPALVSDISGFRDIGGEDGVAYFRSQDAEDFTARLAALLENPSRTRRMGERANHRARPLTWAQIADRELGAFGVEALAEIPLGETANAGA